MTLTSGVLAGTPTAAGSYAFTVTATDSLGSKGSQSYTIVINQPVAITTASLSSWLVNQAGYNQTINATGGTGSLTFTKSAGTLPAGLTLSSTGVLAGTPTTAGSYTFTVQAADTVGAFGHGNLHGQHHHLHSPGPEAGSVTAGSNFNFTLQAEDAGNNPYSGFSGLVTFTTTDPAGGVPATTMVTGGFGFFLASLQTAAGGPWTISATSGAMQRISGPITVVPGKATQLAFTQQPVNTPTGDMLPTVTVQVQDLYGNVITSDNADAVTLGVASGPGSFTAGSTTTAVVHNGVATFNNLTLVVPGTYTLERAGATGVHRAEFDALHRDALAGGAGLVRGHAVGLFAPVQCAVPGQFDDAGAVRPGLRRSGARPVRDAHADSGRQRQSGQHPDRRLAGAQCRDQLASPSWPPNTSLAGQQRLAALARRHLHRGCPQQRGQNGFQALNTGGGFLDGLGTGTPGSGDFTATFTVSAPPRTTMWSGCPPRPMGRARP